MEVLRGRWSLRAVGVVRDTRAPQGRTFFRDTCFSNNTKTQRQFNGSNTLTQYTSRARMTAGAVARLSVTVTRSRSSLLGMAAQAVASDGSSGIRMCLCPVNAPARLRRFRFETETISFETESRVQGARTSSAESGSARSCMTPTDRGPICNRSPAPGRRRAVACRDLERPCLNTLAWPFPRHCVTSNLLHPRSRASCRMVLQEQERVFQEQAGEGVS